MRSQCVSWLTNRCDSSIIQIDAFKYSWIHLNFVSGKVTRKARCRLRVSRYANKESLSHGTPDPVGDHQPYPRQRGILSWLPGGTPLVFRGHLRTRWPPTRRTATCYCLDE